MDLRFGVMLGNRGLFPDHRCDAGRAQILATLGQLGIAAVIVPVDTSKCGSMELNEPARKCAELFRSQAGKIDGLLVTLPKLGDGRGVVDGLRWCGRTAAGLNEALGKCLSWEVYRHG